MGTSPEHVISKIPTKLKEQYLMNLSSQPAPQTRAFQWQLVFITVMLLAAAVTSGLYFATVQAESHGAITGLTLTSNAPGTLTVSWDAASPIPTDYRVDWAKSDEDYQSWKVNEGARLSGGHRHDSDHRGLGTRHRV